MMRDRALAHHGSLMSLLALEPFGNWVQPRRGGCEVHTPAKCSSIGGSPTCVHLGRDSAQKGVTWWRREGGLEPAMALDSPRQSWLVTWPAHCPPLSLAQASNSKCGPWSIRITWDLEMQCPGSAESDSLRRVQQPMVPQGLLGWETRLGAEERGL